MISCKLIFSVGIFGCLISAAAPAPLDIETWRARIKENNADIRALDLRLQAEKNRIEEEGDMALSPFLSFEAHQLDDEKPQMLPAQQGTQTKSKGFNLGVAKAFSTGTQSRVYWSQDYTELFGIAFPVTPAWAGAVGFEVQQSLWRDFFGRQTRIRRRRESAQQELALLTLTSQSSQLWAAAEDAYWNWIQKATEKDIHSENLTRAQNLLGWMKRQYSRSLNSESDFLQVQTLVTARELQTATANDDYLKAIEQMRTFDATFQAEQFVIPAQEKWKTMALRPSGSRIRVDARIAQLTAKMAQSQSEEASETLRPDLNLIGRYVTNDRNESLGAANPSFETEKDTTFIGLQFRMNLDFGAVSKIRSAASSSAEAARIKAEKSVEDGRRAWAEFVRSHNDLTQRLSLAEKLVSLRQQVARKERTLLEKGRASTFQVIQFEQQQAEAQLMWIQTLMGLRRMEAQAQLFTEDQSS
jgi:outer membrane protein TolC